VEGVQRKEKAGATFDGAPGRHAQSCLRALEER
jgi:hypothetical protein